MRWIILCGIAAIAPAFAQDVKTTTLDLKFTILDLRFVISDVAGAGKSMTGATTALQTQETLTDVRIELAADVLFDFDKATLRPAGVDALKQVAQMIRTRHASGVRIEGHTDSKGTPPYNQRLSEARAKSVRDWLQADGLNVRYTIEGFGARRPAASNTHPDGSDDPDGRQKNRRVEIIFAKG